MRYFILSCFLIVGITKNLIGQCNYPVLNSTVIDSCNFEMDSCVYFIEPDSANIWVKGIPQKSFFGDAHSFPAAVMTDSINPYPMNNNDFVQFDIPNLDIFYSNVYFEFWHKFQFDTLNDGGYFQVAFDDSPYFTKKQLVNYETGEDYYQVIDFCGLYDENSDLFSDTINGFTGNMNDWSYSRILFIYELPARLGNKQLKLATVEIDTIHIRFYIKSDSIDGGEAGWIIDDFRFGTADLGGSINQSDFDQQIKSYPNPVSEEVTLFMHGLTNENVHVEVMDITGRTIKSFENIFTDAGGYTTIDLSDIPTGIWMIRVSNENEFWTTKIIKQ